MGFFLLILFNIGSHACLSADAFIFQRQHVIQPEIIIILLFFIRQLSLYYSGHSDIILPSLCKMTYDIVYWAIYGLNVFIGYFTILHHLLY